MSILILMSILIICSCTQRREFCDCMDISKALTDGFTLSKQEMEAKERGCKWIEEKLSQMEQLQQMSQCYKVKSNEIKTTHNNANQIQEEPQIDTQQVPNVQPETENVVEENPKEETAITLQPEESQITSNSNGELSFMYNYVHKKTKEVGILGNYIFKNRLENLLGTRFSDLQRIYDNSESSEIWIPYKKIPNEIDISFYVQNGGQVNIVVDPKKNLINVKIQIDGKTEDFYENGVKTQMFIEVYNY